MLLHVTDFLAYTCMICFSLLLKFLIRPLVFVLPGSSDSAQVGSLKPRLRKFMTVSVQLLVMHLGGFQNYLQSLPEYRHSDCCVRQLLLYISVTSNNIFQTSYLRRQLYSWDSLRRPGTAKRKTSESTNNNSYGYSIRSLKNTLCKQ